MGRDKVSSRIGSRVCDANRDAVTPPVGVFIAGHLGVSQGMTPSAFWLSIGDKSKSGGVLEVEIHAWERVWPKSNNIRIIFKEEYQ